MIVCKLCGREIEEPRKAWREHLGWVSPKGSKAMTGAHNTGELAHPECIVRIRQKMPPGQDSLL